MLHQWAREKVVEHLHETQLAKQDDPERDVGVESGSEDVVGVESDDGEKTTTTVIEIENVAAKNGESLRQPSGVKNKNGRQDSEKASFLVYWLLLANLFVIRVPFPVDNAREANAIVMFLIGFCAVKAAPPRGGFILRTWARKYWPFLFLAVLVMDYVKGGPWVGVLVFMGQ